MSLTIAYTTFMNKPNHEIVDELNDMLRLSDDAIITMTWKEFYRLCGIERFKVARGEEIIKLASENFSLFVGFGQAAVFVCYDRNFSPQKNK